MDVLRVANNVEDCEEDENCFFCEGRGCISIHTLDDEDSDESVDDEEIEDASSSISSSSSSSEEH